MLKDITLGQYFPGNSVIHRLDPRAKLIVLVAYIVALFLAVSWVSYALMVVFLLACIRISTIRQVLYPWHEAADDDSGVHRCAEPVLHHRW